MEWWRWGTWQKAKIVTASKSGKPEYSPSYVNTCSFTGQSVVDSWHESKRNEYRANIDLSCADLTYRKPKLPLSRVHRTSRYRLLYTDSPPLCWNTRKILKLVQMIRYVERKMKKHCGGMNRQVKWQTMGRRVGGLSCDSGKGQVTSVVNAISWLRQELRATFIAVIKRNYISRT